MSRSIDLYEKGSGGVFNEAVDFNFYSVRSCAIVGNSGTLLDDEFGSEIQKKDCVVRFNAAPIEDFEKHVGSKTTFRVLNGPIMIGGSVSYVTTPTNWIADQSGERMILLPHRLKDKKRHYNKARELAGDQNTLITCSEPFKNWMISTARKLRISKPSTGFKTILMFLSLLNCKIDLYGFGFHLENELGKRHYWETFKQNKTGGHRWDREKKMTYYLAKQFKLEIH